LTDACHGDIRRRDEVAVHLAHDLRQGAHSRKVMESYQTWFGEGPELAILRMLGLFDRPVDEQTVGALCKILSPFSLGLGETKKAGGEPAFLHCGLMGAATIFSSSDLHPDSRK